MTLKYKAKERYAFGWTDPQFEAGEIKMNVQRKTGLEDVPTEVLRNLWLVKFGGRVVTLGDMYALRADDIANVGQELANRKQIRQETLTRPDVLEVKNYYVLEREDGNN
jgi:hypothetical protein